MIFSGLTPARSGCGVQPPTHEDQISRAHVEALDASQQPEQAYRIPLPADPDFGAIELQRERNSSHHRQYNAGPVEAAVALIDESMSFAGASLRRDQQQTLHGEDQIVPQFKQRLCCADVATGPIALIDASVRPHADRASMSQCTRCSATKALV